MATSAPLAGCAAGFRTEVVPVGPGLAALHEPGRGYCVNILYMPSIFKMRHSL